MSNLLQIIDLNFAHQSEPLFSNLNLLINQNDKIGLIGHNGSGKSTLFSLINGQQSLDSGEIRKPKNLKIATVEQFVPEPLKPLSLIDALLIAYPDDQKPRELWRAQRLLANLGFSNQQCQQQVNLLSGGQQNLLLIAKAQLAEPDLLLLDEPGNHMDILAMSQLEQYLANDCGCAFLIISHDKHLLNNACDSTLFLRDKRCQKFEQPFDQANKLLLEQDQQDQQRLKDEQKEINRLQSSAKRLAIIGRENDNAKLAKKAKSMQKKVSRLEQEKTKLTEQSPLKLQLQNSSAEAVVNAKQLLTINGLSLYKGYQQSAANLLLMIGHLIIKPGDRIALLGINGVGKTTTLQAIKAAYQNAQDENYSNSNISFNPRTRLGFYDQELELLDSELSRIDWLRSQTQANEVLIKQALIHSGVAYSAFNRPVDQLSGGEKSRMMFLSLALNQANFMILDEPTNHIDLAGKSQLVKQLTQSQATLLITSHDRDFIDQIANRFLLINDGKLQELNNSEIFYETLINREKQVSPSARKPAHKPNKLIANELNQEQLLERIELLESKINLEIKQSKKRQKALLLKQWQEEHTLLWSKL